MGLILNAEKGISSHQIARDVELTGQHIAHCVRKAIKQDNGLLSGIAEMDEICVGGIC